MSNVISGTAQLPRSSSQFTASQQGPIVQRVNIKGDPGTDGVNAFSITLSVFVMPPADSTTPVSIAVENGSWAGMGQPVFIEGAGQLVVSDTGDPVLLTLVNPGTTGNANPGTSISLGKRVSPSGVPGQDGGGGGGGATGFETVTFTAQGTYVVPSGAAVVVFAGTVDDGGTYLIQLTETDSFEPIVLDFSFINVPTDATINLRIGTSGVEAPIQINQGTNPPIYYNLVYWDGNIGDAPIFMPIISGPPSFPSGGSTSTAPAINIGTDVYPGAGTIVISADDSAADYIQFTASAGLDASGVYTFQLTFPSDTPVTFGSKVLDFSQLLGENPHNSTFRVELGTAGLSLTTLDNSKLFQANGGACIIGWDGASSNITFLPVIISSTAPTIDAGVVTYTPATGGNWSPPPTLAGPALDQLAARLMAGTGVGTYALASTRPSASGSGRLFFCKDIPVAYFDDPSTSSWLQFPWEGLTHPAAASSYIIAPSGSIGLIQYADTLRAATANNNSNTVCALIASGALGQTASWAVTLTATVNPILFQTYPDFGICVTDGSANGSNVYAISAGSNGSAIYVHQQDLVIGSGARNNNIGEQNPNPAPIAFSGKFRARILNDGVITRFQLSSDGFSWQDWNARSSFSGLTHFGFYFGSAAGSFDYGQSIIYENRVSVPLQYTISAVTTPTTPGTFTIGTHALLPGDTVSIQGATGLTTINTNSTGTGQLGSWALVTAISSNSVTLSLNGGAGYTANSATMTLLSR